MGTSQTARLTAQLAGVNRIFSKYEKAVVAGRGMSVQQAGALVTLLDGGLDMGGLADAAAVSVSTMTRLVDGLHRQGWVERGRAPDDRRRVVVLLTDEGRTRAEHVRGLMEQGVGAALARIRRAERASVIAAVARLRETMEQALAEFERCCGPIEPE